MSGTGTSSPFIKDEPEDHVFGSGNQRFMQNTQAFNMPQQHFNQFGNGHGNNGSIDPNALSMPMSVNTGSYMGSNSFQNNFIPQGSNPHASFSKGISALDDDDLLESLGGFTDQGNHQNGVQGSNFNHDLNDFDFNVNSNMNGHMQPISAEQQAQFSLYSSTPDGDPIQSPFTHGFAHQHMINLQQQQRFGGSMQSPTFAGSPLANNEMRNGSIDNNYMNSKGTPRSRPAMAMQRRSSNNRSPLTPHAPSLSLNNVEYASQPMATSGSRHQKAPSGQWDGVNSLGSFPGSGSQFSSPVQHPNPAISDILKAGSMPAKLSSGSAPAMQTQEMKRRRRRESHNLVERRRRDNINERIQELSHLVPMHRLEDEKVRKALQNNSPLSPILGSTSMSPPQATSGLAGPGAKRASGSITTGLPIEDKDKGPNKGDILNGAVSWTRDLMWMLYLKLQQQEELANQIHELGGIYPFEQTEDERRMQTELMDAISKNGEGNFGYSRTPGSGLRVPKHTDMKGDIIGANGVVDSDSVSPDNHSSGDAGQTGVGGAGQYWSGHNSGGSGPGSISFKEEDEFMNLDQ